jgi:hypothetical protein
MHPIAFVVCVLGVLSSSCSQNPGSCDGPMATITEHLVSGTITFTIGGGAPETHELSYSEIAAPSPGMCNVGHLIDEVFSDEFVNGAGPSVNCAPAQSSMYLNLHELRDPRGLTAGTRTMTSTEAGLTFEVSEGLPAQCRVEVTTATINVDVSRAEGAAAPFPTLVTSDYAREFAIHVETVARQVAFGSGCSPASAVLDLKLSQTAADAFFDPMAHIPCE